MEMQENATIRIWKAPKESEASYCTVTADGRLIHAYGRLSDIRRFYRQAIRLGHVTLIRELDKVYQPKR